ncbi:hypothetical protein EC968_008173 [Mortierella alpina]|nr:hypothetical protein EC968_008173 [Mortierella alpina]
MPPSRVPRCLQFFPGVVLDVVLSNAFENVPIDSSVGTLSTAPTATLNSALTVGQCHALTDSPADPPSEDKVIEDLQVTSTLAEMTLRDIGTRTPSTGPSVLPLSSPSKVETASKTALAFIETVRRASKRTEDSDGEAQQQDLNTKMSYMIKLQKASEAKQEEMIKLQEASDAKQQEMIKLQEASDAKQQEIIKLQEASDAKQQEIIKLQKTSDAKQEEIIRLQKEMKQTEQRVLQQLSVLHSRVQAVLTQTYELHEYPIPRLFIVLPQFPSGWDILEPFTDKYRLYFLCECGEHTRAASSNDKVPHEIHLAKHEGYEIARPTAFFQQYGPYVLTILKMLKFSVSVASVAVPAVAHLTNADALDHAAKGLQHLKDCIEPGMDQVISKIEKVSVDEGEAVDEFAEQMKKKEALAGADLRKLDTFLKDKDGNKVLGNLYRTVTDEGHVKWVCIDHYSDNYQESTAKDFQRILDAVGGSFDKTLGRVEVTLRSRVLAELFFSALGKARSVYELDTVFDWACTASDLAVLEGALKKSRVVILRLDIRRFRASNLSWTSAQNAVLFRIKGLPNMRILHVVLSKDVVKLLSNQPKTSSQLCKLSIEVTPGSVQVKEIEDLAEILKTNSTLTSLSLESNAIGDDGATALAEALKTNSTLDTLDLRGNTIWFKGLLAFLELLQTNSTLTTLDLRTNKIGDSVAQALAESLKTDKTLTTLDLQHNSIGDHGAKELAEALRTNSTLTTLNLYSNSIGGDGAKELAEVVKTNSTLITLNLQYNSIGDDGANALAEALRTNSTLTSLNLHSDNIEGEGAKALAEALKTNSTLSTLDLQDNKIGDDGAKALAEALKTNSTLTALNLQDNKIGDNGANALAEALKTNSSLTKLNLLRNSVWYKGFAALTEASKQNSTLTTLDILGFDNIAMVMYQAFKTNSTLSTLDLRDNKIGDDEAKALAEALKTNSTRTSIGSDGAKALAGALKTNSSLTTLNLECTSISPDGAKALAEALKTNSTVTTLNLSWNSIGDDGAKALAEALKTNSTVATLDLSWNSIGDDGAKALAEAIRTNLTVATLNLKDNSIGDDGAKALAEALKTNLTVATLYLKDNKIGDDGTKALAEAFKTNSSLTISGI